MFFYYCAALRELPSIKQNGITAPPGQKVLLRTDLEEALAYCPDALLVADLDESKTLPGDDDGQALSGPVPAAAIRNLAPYLPPRPVVAAGGYLMRFSAEEPEVLLIFRRGVWDLPKGKQDAGETIHACALREIGEEIGAEDLRIKRSLGVTVHGYPERGIYRVKTTHWFLVQSNQEVFYPEAEEDIEKVAWMPWSEAKRRIGHETLRRHMQHIDPVLLEGGV